MLKGFALVLCMALVRVAPLKAQDPDSLLNVYNNPKHADTTRLRALHQYAWDMLFIDPEKAREYALEELGFATRLKDKNAIALAQNTLGNAWHVMGEYEKAIREHKKALKLRTAIKNQLGIAASLSNLGNEYLCLSDYPSALDHYQQALKIEENLGNMEGVAQSHINLGLLYDHVASGSGNDADRKRALDHYFKGLEISEKIGDKHSAAASLGNIGNMYEEYYKDRTKAMQYQRKCLQYYKESKDDLGMAQTYGNIGNTIQDMSVKELAALGIDSVNRYDSTLKYYVLCHKLMSGLNHPPGVAISLKNMGWVKVQQEKYPEALKLLKQALEINRAIGDKDNEKATEALLWDCYKHMNDPANALLHYERYVFLRDSIYQEETLREITRKELDFKYATKATADSLKRAQERVLLDVQLKQERNTRYYLFAGLGLIAVFSLFIFNRFRVTKKQKGIIEEQKVVVEEQNKKVMHQKELLEEKNKEVVDSIQYAKRLQDAILPPHSFWKTQLPDSFIYYRPKDIVAGDFYWMESVQMSGGNSKILFAVADSTGHGVPGALVSVVCSNALNRAVKEFNLAVPGEILDKVRELVKQTFRTENELTEVKDGMDISLCSIDVKNRSLEWAGANNPLWILHKNSGEVTEINADKQPIGYHHVQKPFTTHRLPFEKGDRIFLFTDGYADQFGGEKGKKFKYSNLKALFGHMQKEPLSAMPEKLEKTMLEWRRELEQIDDICIVGVGL